MNVVQLWKRLFVVALVAGLLPASSDLALADTIHVGNTYFADDLEDDTIGSNPNNTAGFVTLASFSPSAYTRVRTDPAGGSNQVLLSDTSGAAHGLGPITGTTGKRYGFSGAMVAGQPDVGNLSYRVYLDQLDGSASLLSAVRANNGSTGTLNQAFSLRTSATKFQFVSTNGVVSGGTTNVVDLVFDEWVNVSIDYDLTSTINNLELTLTSPTIGTNVSTYSTDLTGLQVAALWVFNRGTTSGAGHDIIAIDDINWTAVPEPTSLALCSLAALLVGGVRRKKSS